MVVQYPGNVSLFFAILVRNIVKVTIAFKTRRLKTFLPSLKTSFTLESISNISHQVSCFGCESNNDDKTVRYLSIRIGTPKRGFIRDTTSVAVGK